MESIMRVIDRTGHRYERLVALERLAAKSKTDTNARWICRCDCGIATVAYGQDLARGKVKSCGCLNAERIMQHGMSGTPVYAVWQAMLQRCENPKAQSYENYGGRGISVCEKWHTFEGFWIDMKNPPRGYSLDRIDNDGNYCKENCRWALTKQQANNKRKNRRIEFNGETRTLAEWAEKTGLGWSTLRTRLDNYGWTVKKTLTTPATLAAIYKFKGRKKTLREWSEETGINYETLSARVRKLGWPIDRALTEAIASKDIKRKT